MSKAVYVEQRPAAAIADSLLKANGLKWVGTQPDSGQGPTCGPLLRQGGRRTTEAARGARASGSPQVDRAAGTKGAGYPGARRTPAYVGMAALPSGPPTRLFISATVPV